MDFDVLGRSVSGDIDQRLASALREEWVTPFAGDKTDRLGPAPFRVTLETTSAPVPADIAVAHGAIGPLGSRHIRIGTDGFWILEDVDGALHGVHGQLGPDAAELTLYGAPFRGIVALRNAMVEALGASGIVRLHAAAIHDGTNTLALLGPTGRGKSTTLLRAVTSGWRPIAEDACLLDPLSLRLFGVDRILRLRPEALAVLGSRPGGMEPGPQVDGRHEIPYERLGGRVRSAKLTHLVRLVRTGSVHAEWKPLANATAVMALHQSTGIANTDRVGRINAAAFGDIVRDTRALELHLGAATSPIPSLAELVDD